MKTVVAKRENNEIDEDTEYFIKEVIGFETQIDDFLEEI